MPRRFRNILLGIIILLFSGIGAYLITRGNGLVWDKETLSFVKTGGIFLSFDPWGAVIYLNGKRYPGTTSFLSRGTLIPNLPPKSYTVRLEKDGYFPWEKILPVAPGKVASAHDVRMWPQSPQGTIVAGGVNDFWITRGGILYNSATGTLEFENHPIRGKTVFFSSPQSDWVVTKDRSSLFLTDLTDPNVATNLSSLVSSLLERLNPKASPDILALFPNPSNRSRLLIQTKTGLYSLDAGRVELTQLISIAPRSFFAISDRSAHVFGEHGDLQSYYFPLGTSASTTLILPFTTSSLYGLRVSPDGNTFVFETEKGAYLYDASDRRFFGTAAAGATTRIFSPEGKRMVSFFTKNKLTVTYLKEYEHDELFAKGAEETGVVPYPITGATQTAWLSYQNALLLMNLDSIIGTDTDLRPPSNTRLLVRDIKKAAWNDSLFILKQNGELWEIEY